MRLFQKRRVESEIETHIPRLRRYARALCGNPDDADDLVQDCLRRALERQSLWQKGSDLRAWLFTILHNLHVDQRRYAARRPHIVDLDDVVVSRPPCQPSIVHMSEMDRFLSYLSDEHRSILLLIGVEGVSYEEAAQILNVPKGTVMSRLSRARDQLRRLMSGEAPTALRRVK